MNVALVLALAADVRTRLAARYMAGHLALGQSPTLHAEVDQTVIRLLTRYLPDSEVDLSQARKLIDEAEAEILRSPAWGMLPAADRR